MKSKYLAAGVLSGIAGSLIAWKFLKRKNEINWTDVMDSVVHSEHSQFVEIDGMHIHYQEFGVINKPTLLLIHGYTASTYVWNAVAPLFAENGFRVIAVDLIGFGYSSKPEWFDYSIASQARIISRFMNRLGIGRATVIGSSYGGAVASTIALDYSERVEKLVLIDAVCNDDVADDNLLLRFVKVRGIGEFLVPFLSDSKLFAKYRMRKTVSSENYHLITDERLSSSMRPLNAKDGHHSVLTTARNWDACRIEKDAQYINQPTLIIWGENDTVIPIRNGYSLHNSILNSKFVILRECGHVPHEEKPELFVEILTSFCQDSKGRLELAENEQVKFATK